MSLLSNSPTAILDVGHSLQLAPGAGGGTGRRGLRRTTDAAMLLSPHTPPARAPELGTHWLPETRAANEGSRGLREILQSRRRPLNYVKQAHCRESGGDDDISAGP